MLSAFLLSVRQLGDGPILRVLFKSLLVTVLVLAMLVAGIWFGARTAVQSWFGAGDGSANFAALAAALGALFAAWLLFRAVAIAVIGVFADEVVAAVEQRHYPDALAGARPVAFGRSVAMGIGSAVRAILVNLLMSPIYLALLVTGVGTAGAFLLVNGWLLGRDLGDMAAARHLPPRELPQWRGRTRMVRFVLGLAATTLLLVPFVNLVAPILGAAMATHLFHRRLRT